MSNAYSEYVPQWERPVITALVKALLDRGYYLAVHNGEEYESKRTQKLTTLRPAFGSTGEDSLVVWDENKERIGSFYLIYDNGSEYDPMIVISDYGWTNDATEKVFDSIFHELGNKYGDA